MDEPEPTPAGEPDEARNGTTIGPRTRTENEPEAPAEDLDQLRAERDRLLAERDRLRQAERDPSAPTTAPSRRRLLVIAGAAVAAALAAPVGFALVDGDGSPPRRPSRSRPRSEARVPPPVDLPARPRLRQLATLTGHQGEIGTFRFSPDGTTLASIEALDGVLRLWDITTHEERAEPVESSLVLFTSVAFSPDGQTVATGADDRVQFWDAATLRPQGDEIADRDDPFLSFEAVAFSPNGDLIATSGSMDDQVRFYDPATRRSLGRPLEQGRATQLVFSPDGRTLAGVGWSGMDGVHLWDVESRSQRPQPPMNLNGPPGTMVFSPDSATLALVDYDQILLVDPATGTENAPGLRPGGTSITDVAYSTDGATLLTADYGSLQTWDASTHAHRGSVDTSETFARFALSPDGRTLATRTFQDTTIKLWRLE